MEDRRVIILGFFLMISCFYAARILDADPTVEVEVNPSKTVKVGADCYLTLNVVWRIEEADYQFQEPALPLENLVIREKGEASEVFVREGKEWKRKSFRFILTPTKAGMGSIRSFRIAFFDPAKQLGSAVDVGPVDIRIVPDRSQFYKNLILLFSLAGGVGAFGAVFYHSFRKRANAVVDPISTLEERSLLELEALQKTLKSQTAHGVKISKADRILRAYLMEKLSIQGPVLSGREFMGKFEDRLLVMLAQEEAAELRDLIARLEESSFASSDSSGPKADELVLRIKRFIEARKPVPAG